MSKKVKTASKIMPWGFRTEHIPHLLKIIASYLPFFLLIIFFESTFAVPYGVDPSYEWLLTHATEKEGFFSNSFIGTYGGLGFLEFQWSESLIMKLLALTWHSFVVIYFAKMLTSWFKLSGFINSGPIQIAVSIFFIIYISNYTQFSTLLVLAVFLDYIRRETISSKFIAFLFALSVIASQIKFMPFALISFMSIVSGIRFWRENGQPLKLIRVAIYLITSIFLSTVSALVINSEFRDWVRGYFETIVGYPAMAYHPNSYMHLLAFTSTVVLLARKTPRDNGFLFVSLGYAIIFFQYGFTREDFFHTISAQVFLISWSFAVAYWSKNDLAPKSKKWLDALLLLTTCFLTFSAKSSSLVFSDLFLVLVVAWIVLVLNKFDYFLLIPLGALTSLILTTSLSPYAAFSELTSAFPYNSNFKGRMEKSIQFFAELGNEGVDNPTLGSTRELIGLAGGIPAKEKGVLIGNNFYEPMRFLNVHPLPIPMLFGVFTPWLDSQNINYLDSKDISFIAFEKNSAIDQNTWFTEAPATSLYIFCHFSFTSRSENWMLLSRLPESRCLFRSTSQAEPRLSHLVLQDLRIPRTPPGSEFIRYFSDRKNYVYQVTGKRIGIQPKNNKGILVSVPSELDFPKPWNINNRINLIRNNISKTYYVPLK